MNSRIGDWATALVKACPVLSRELEDELARRIEGGDNDAAWELARGSVKLAVKLATKYAWNDQEAEELTAEGILGLHDAALRFDRQRGLRFCTYAVHWVMAHIRKKAKSMRLPVHLPSRVESGAIALPLELEYGDGELYENPMLPSYTLEDDSIQRRFFWQALLKLPERMREIIVRRTVMEHTLKEIGEDLGLSRERIRQLQNKGFERLRRYIGSRNAA